MTKEELKKVEQEIKEFLSELEIPITTKTDFDEVFGIINVQLDSEEAAALIGFHGGNSSSNPVNSLFCRS